MNNKNSFVLHDGFFELLAALPPDKCKEMLMAYGNYALKGEITTFADPLMAAVFAREKTIADSDMRKYAEKSEVRRAAALKKWGAESSDGVTNRSKRLAEARAKGTHTKSEWDEMRNFFGCCVKCGKSAEDVELVKDHIIPIYQGGSDSITNLQPLCRSCNSSKGPDSKDYRLKFCDEKRLQMPAKWVQTPATPADTDTDTDTDTVPTVSNTSRTDVLEDAEIVEIETEISGKNSKRVRAREKPETPKEVTWRDSFDVYLQDCRDAWKRWMNDRDWLEERRRFNPGVDIRLTLEKACKEFWATEAGWLHKKKGRGKTIDWKRTFEYAISQKTNRVYERSKDNSRGKDGLTDEEREQFERTFQGIINASRGR